MRLPSWMWNGALDDFLRAAGLNSVTDAFLAPDELRIETFERSSRERPGLVKIRQLAGPPMVDANYDPVTAAEASQLCYLNDGQVATTQRRLERLEQSALGLTAAGLQAPGLGFHQLQTMLAESAAMAETVKTAVDDLRGCRLASTDEQLFPLAGVLLVQRAPALLHRSKIPAVLLRVAVDGRLRSADLEQVKAASANREVVFAASDGLGDGFALLDPYLAPLLGAMTPYVWAFSASRPASTIVYTLGRCIAGVAGEALEPLHLLPSRGSLEAISPTELSPEASPAAVTWWVRRLDKVLSVISDPALFADADGRYVPTHHQHAMLSLDQLFRRVGSIQQAHRDGDARRVLLFTVLDTLERLTDRTLVELCTYQFAASTLERVRRDMNADMQQVLLPAAVRAVHALALVQEGFYVRRQTGAATIDFNLSDGTSQSYTPERAAAEYIRVLRNATHGHGSNRADAVPRTDALLAHHDGAIHHDLPLLGYLYLLELMTKPDMLRRVLFSSTRV